MTCATYSVTCAQCSMTCAQYSMTCAQYSVTCAPYSVTCTQYSLVCLCPIQPHLCRGRGKPPGSAESGIACCNSFHLNFPSSRGSSSHSPTSWPDAFDDFTLDRIGSAFCLSKAPGQKMGYLCDVSPGNTGSSNESSYIGQFSSLLKRTARIFLSSLFPWLGDCAGGALILTGPHSAAGPIAPAWVAMVVVTPLPGSHWFLPDFSGQ
ncbi:hypothetical protein AB205_0093120 [Aquarana catesbeiana]|uniref:Uncharacterized protein n=1 Tax=Aquarana catesbeiana TaxID=8400 RepID=A0A2G9R7L6_AQUCT|nr:hypothetical protein AB205_0093120 [Aquarana catesbeiana]